MLNSLIYNNVTYDDKYIFGGVKYSIDINADTNIIVGGAYAAKIEFTTDNATLAVVGNDILYKVKQMDASTYKTVGRFIVSDVTKNRDKYQVVAYDYISKFDKVVDDKLEALWPTTSTTITAEQLLAGLCANDCINVNHTTINSSWYTRAIPKCISGSNITGRSVLSWLAAYVGGFAVVTYTNNVPYITIKRFTTNSSTISSYKSFDKGEVIPQIDSLWVGQSTSDVGTTIYVSGTTSNNLLRIAGNPLFNIMSDSDVITGQMTIVLNAVKNISYTPTTIELFKDYDIDAGSIITAKSTSTLVMSKSWSNTGVEFKSTGSAERDVAQTSQEIINLNGQYHNIKNTVDEHTEEIGDLEGDVSTVTQTANAVSAEVTSARGTSSSLRLELDRIESTVSRGTQTFRQATAPTTGIATGDLWYYTGTTTSTYTNGWWYRYNGSTWEHCEDPQVTTNTSSITQQADKIALVVEESSGTNVIKAASIVTAINDSGSTVKIDADKIQMTGTTTFLTASDVGSGGSTVISGDRISTGTINADTVNVTNINANNIKVSGKSIGSSTTSLNSIYTLKSYDGEEYVTNNCYVGTGDSGNLYIRTYEGGSYTQSTRLSPSGVTYGGTTYRWDAIGSGSGATYPYISNASVSNGVLTLTKQTSSSASTTITYQALFG